MHLVKAEYHIIKTCPVCQHQLSYGPLFIFETFDPSSRGTCTMLVPVIISYHNAIQFIFPLFPCLVYIVYERIFLVSILFINGSNFVFHMSVNTFRNFHYTDNTGGTILLKGEKSQVLQTVNSLTELLSSGISAETRKPLCCSPFTWYNLAHTCPVSPPYWTKFGGNTPLTHLSKATRAEKRWTLVPVDKPTEKAVRGLVQATWAEQLVGKGRDAVNLNHKRIRVDKVERIENIDVFSKYAAKRLEQFRMLAEEGSSTLTPLEHAPIKTQGAIATTLKSTSILYEDIFPEINEYYMFHGTKPDVVQTLMMQGLDCRMSDDKAMFGTGIYGAETSTKADQYAGTVYSAHVPVGNMRFM